MTSVRPFIDNIKEQTDPAIKKTDVEQLAANSTKSTHYQYKRYFEDNQQITNTNIKIPPLNVNSITTTANEKKKN
jgi:hypothetical protein